MAKPISRLHYLPFGAEKARTTTSPVSANHLFSMSRRAEGCVKGSVGPFQLKISEGVTDCIALASSGGRKHHSLLITGPYRYCRDMSTAFRTCPAVERKSAPKRPE